MPTTAVFGSRRLPGTRYPIGIATLAAAATLRARRLAPAKTDFLGKFGTLGRVVGGNHGIIGRKPPLCTIGVGRQVVSRANISLQHLQFLAVFKTDNVFGTDRL